MNVLYYYYYLFYTKIIPDDEPHATVIFTLSFTESWLIYGFLQIVTAYLYCESYTKWVGIGILVGLLILNYLIYVKSGRGKKIIKDKPQIINHSFSIFITASFCLGCVSYLFWGSFYIREILARC